MFHTDISIIRLYLPKYFWYSKRKESMCAVKKTPSRALNPTISREPAAHLRPTHLSSSWSSQHRTYCTCTLVNFNSKNERLHERSSSEVCSRGSTTLPRCSTVPQPHQFLVWAVQNLLMSAQNLVSTSTLWITGKLSSCVSAAGMCGGKRHFYPPSPSSFMMMKEM